jgi:hypothetical protein
VTIEIPATGERLEARLVEPSCGPLCLALGRTRRPSYVLAAVLEIGWRILDSTPVERALMETYGITPDSE